MAKRHKLWDDKKNKGRTYLRYLEALQDARFRVMDGASDQEALDYVKTKYGDKLESKELDRIRHHIAMNGGTLVCQE